MDIGITLTAFGAMMAGFFAIAKIMLTQASADRDADRKERDLLTKSIKSMASATEKVAVATNRSAVEAKQRNGHLGDQNLKLAELVTAQNKDVTAIKDSTAKTAAILSKSALIAAEDRDILTNGSQTILEQNVEHLHVEQSNLKEKI